ncbi:MAG: alanine--tRNA ligase [Pseudomonadota bacterium]
MRYTSAAIRAAFLDFFAQHQHQQLPSGSLVPDDTDTSLLFTNAGMVPFKSVFLGQVAPSDVRVTTAQRCVRAGGKHNDLDQVGYTARHHTFFEMLGNFSFGDYFKREAIQFAWQFLTQVLQLPPEKLWVTVYQSDDEAAAIWLDEMGVDTARFSRIGDKSADQPYVSDNFWSMGDTGPCGPCSEIFYDHGPDIPGGPPGTPEEDGDRYIELWNLVFMQYNRDAAGQLTPLPKPSVDTGMGLERLAAVLQGVHSNYETDLFQALIQAAAAATDTRDLQAKSLRVIADHIRSAAFMVVDGVLPANEGRGYVLRRIIRRAVRHGYQLGQQQLFFHTLVDALDQQMGDAYPELRQAKTQVMQVLESEETRFAETLSQGMRMLDEVINDLSGHQVPGEVCFKLYDTYGFPLDLTADIAREQGLSVDAAGFEQAMAAQQARGRAASRFAAEQSGRLPVSGKTDFVGYDHLTDRATVVALFCDGAAVDVLLPSQSGAIVLDKTVLYAESGGQVGDTGLLAEGENCFRVHNTQKQGDVIVHIGRQQTGCLRLGEMVQVTTDAALRQQITLNHSATHLLHAALRQILGSQVQQQGSLVTAQRLRFDFSYTAPLSTEQIEAVEQLVNAHIRQNHLVETRLMALEDAQASGALALFGEKYAAQVRVLRMGDFSTELCGGTHVRATGDIGLCKIIAETGVAAGVRRIEALTGEEALRWVTQSTSYLTELGEQLHCTWSELPAKLGRVLSEQKQLHKTIQALQAESVAKVGMALASQVVEVAGIKVLSAKVPSADKKSLRGLLDQLQRQLVPSVIMLATVSAGKVQLFVAVSQTLQADYPAHVLLQQAAVLVNGKGGGRADRAQAGGTNPSGLTEALALVSDWVSVRAQNKSDFKVDSGE